MPLKMEPARKRMDFSIKHCAPLVRHFPARFNVETVGYMPRKTDWVRHAFESCNFSFILSGGGTFTRGDRTWRVVPPCVLTQWPGDFVSYGPTEPSGMWEELFLIYPAAQYAAFLDGRLIDPAKPVWSIASPERVHAALAGLNQAIATLRAEGAADRVDRWCEQLILESLLSDAGETPAADADPLDRLAHTVRQHPEREIDWDVQARRSGRSIATFRRHWRERFGDSPAHYQQAIRLSRARQWLVETTWPIKTVAERCGFTDPLYFSRRFHAVTGDTPSSYREKHKTER